MPRSPAMDPPQESPRYAAKTDPRFQDCPARRSVSRHHPMWGRTPSSVPPERSEAHPGTRSYFLLPSSRPSSPASRHSLAFFVGFRLALLDNLGLGPERLPLPPPPLPSSHNFFLTLVRAPPAGRVRKEFQFFVMRQIRHAQHFADVSSLTSTSMCPGMSPGRHSISTSRRICSRMPPSVFHAAGTPCSMIGTLTRNALSMAMRFSRCASRCPLMGRIANPQSLLGLLAAIQG